MYPVSFKESNTVLAAPKGQEETCGSLEVFMDGHFVISAWRPTAQELVRLNMGEPLYLVVHGANTPPFRITTDSPFSDPIETLPATPEAP